MKKAHQRPNPMRFAKRIPAVCPVGIRSQLKKPLELLRRVDLSKFLVEDQEPMAVLADELKLFEDGPEELLFFMLLGDEPLQEGEGREVLFFEGGAHEFVDRLRNEEFMVKRLLEDVLERLEVMLRSFKGGYHRHGARIAEVVEETLLMFELFLGMRIEEARSAFKGLRARPRSHLLIKERREKLEVHLFIDLFSQLGREHF